MKDDLHRAAYRSGRHRQHHPRSLILLAVAVVAVGAVVFAGLTALTTDSSASAGTSCKDFYFLSIRGSGQTDNGPNSQTASPETQAVLRGIQSAYGSVNRRPNFDFYNIQYPARSVPSMLVPLALAVADPFNPFLRFNARFAVAQYLDGEQQAEYQVSKTVDQIVVGCSTARIVVAGYSQGAMAAHNYLVNSKHAGNIFGAVLIADPERLPNSQVKNYGNAPQNNSYSYGLCSVLERLPQTGRPSCLPNYQKVTEIPGNLRSVTSQVCNGTDAVCDTGSDVKVRDPWGDFERLDAGALYLHMNCYAYCGGTVELPGNVIGHRLVDSAASAAPAPVLRPASSVAGYRIAVGAQPCPAGNPQAMSITVNSADGSVVGSGGGGAPHGETGVIPPEFTTYVRQIPGTKPTHTEPAPGRYQVNMKCIDNVTNAVTRVYAPATYTVTGPSPSVQVDHSQASRGSQVVFSAQPGSCPNGQDAFAMITPLADVNEFIPTDHVTVGTNGGWSAPYTIPSHLGPGEYAITGQCQVRGADFVPIESGYSGTLDIS